MLQQFDIEQVRDFLQKEVGCNAADGAAILTAALADSARQFVSSHSDDDSGVSRRRVLYGMANFRKRLLGICSDDAFPTSNEQMLDTLVALGDFTQEDGLLFKTQLRVSELLDNNWVLLHGSLSTNSLDPIVKMAVRSSGIGRIIPRETALLAAFGKLPLGVWLGSSPFDDLNAWYRNLCGQLQSDSAEVALELDNLEIFSRLDGNRCKWMSLAKDKWNSSQIITSTSDAFLIRETNGSRVLGYRVFFGDPHQLGRTPLRGSRLSISDGRRFALALRADLGLPQSIRWDRIDSTSSNDSNSSLLRLRIAWGDVPSPESTMRHYGTPVVIGERRFMAFDEYVVPLVNVVLSKIGFNVK